MERGFLFAFKRFKKRRYEMWEAEKYNFCGDCTETRNP